MEHLRAAIQEFVEERGNEERKLLDDVFPGDEATKDLTGEELIQGILQDIEFFLEGKIDGFNPDHITVRAGADVKNVGKSTIGTYDDEVDLVFVRWFLNGIEGMRDRIFGVPAMIMSKAIPAEVRTYTVQATRCYVLGLFQASAVLCRAALEATLRDYLGETGKDFKLDELFRLSKSRQLFQKNEVKSLWSVRIIGNKAAHGRLIVEEDAKVVVFSIREFVGRLYEPRKHGGQK
jgi:hypothetical protein